MIKIEWEKLTSKQFKIVMQAMLILSDQYVEKAIVAIYDLQTDDEKCSRQSSYDNNVGFTKVDATFLSKMARKLKRNEHLTDGEMACSRNKIQKYWRQLMTLTFLNLSKQEHVETIKELETDGEQLSFF